MLLSLSGNSENVLFIKEMLFSQYTSQKQYEESLSSSLQACVSAVEKLSAEVHQLKKNLSSSPPVQTSVSATRGKRPSVQGR